MGVVANSGLVVLTLLTGLVAGYFVGRARLSPKLRLAQQQLTIKERSMDELRYELSEDKVTNRKLRYQLSRNSNAAIGNSDRSETRELEEAIAEVQRLDNELATTRTRLAERNDAMRVARDAIQEIRQQIEGSNSIQVRSGDYLAPSDAEYVDERLASLEDVTGEINLQL